MNFQLTNENLRRLSGQSGVTQEEAVNFFRDFCRDVKNETGKNVDSGQSENLDALVPAILWAGQLVLNLAKRNEAGISSEDRKHRLTKLSMQIEATQKMLETVEAAFAENAQKAAELKAKEQHLSKKREEAEVLEAEIAALTEGIRHMQTVDLEELQREREDLLKKREEIEKQRNALQAETERLREEMNAKQEQLREEVEAAKAELRAEKAQKDSEIEELEAEAKAVKDDITAAAAEISALQGDIAGLKDRYTDALAFKEGETQRKLALEAKADQLNEDCVKLREDIRALEAILQGKDYEKQKEYLRNLKEKLTNEAQAFEELGEEIHEAENAIQGQKQDRMAREAELANLRSSLLGEIEACNKALQALQERNDTLEAQKKDLERRADKEKALIEARQVWFDGADGAKKLEEVNRLEKRRLAIEAAWLRLENDLGAKWYTNRFDSVNPVEIATEEKKLQYRMANIREELDSLRFALDGLSDSLSSKD